MLIIKEIQNSRQYLLIESADKNKWKASLLAEILAEKLLVHYRAGGAMTELDGNSVCLYSIVRILKWLIVLHSINEQTNS